MFPLPLFILMEPYTLTLSLFERTMAAHNFIAFYSFYINPWEGLIGSKGITPAKEMMQRVKLRGWEWKRRWRDLPTLLWYSDSDEFIRGVQLAGMTFSLLAFLGVFSGLSMLGSCVCYSSIKTVGNVFTGLQMHAHIMEINLLYIACSPFLHVCPSAFVVLASLLNFRVMMGGGAGKWYGRDKSWHDGTAMAYHYWTQPLPNPISPYMHRMPFWAHKLETYATFIHESFAALFVFAPVYLRVVAFVGFQSIMVVINLTGNFAQIGVLTCNESLLLLNDNIYHWLFDTLAFIPGVQALRSWLLWAHSPPLVDLALPASSDNALSIWNIGFGLVPWICFVLPYAFVQWIPLAATFKGNNPLTLLDPYTTRPSATYQSWIQSDAYKKHIEPTWKRLQEYMLKAFMIGRDFDLFGSYVKFGHMTKFRHEIILEASQDGRSWSEYIFKYKPSLVTKRPPWIPGHLPAMDWRLWFLPLEAARGGEAPGWFLRLMVRLLECEPSVQALFEYVPFDGSAEKGRPKFLRALLYDYRFAYKYEHEDEMKKMVKRFGVRDTLIDTDSEEEYESDEQEEQEQEQEEKQQETKEPTKEEAENGEVEGEEDEEEDEQVEQSPQESPPSASTRSKARARLAESKTQEKRDMDEEEKERGDAKTDEPVQGQNVPPASRTPKTASTMKSARKSSDTDDKDDDASKASAAFSSAASASSSSSSSSSTSYTGDPLLDAHLRRLFRPRRRRPKVTRPHPQFNEAGERIWWVRRKLVGSYGPTLMARDEGTTTMRRRGDALEDTWEGYLSD